MNIEELAYHNLRPEHGVAAAAKVEGFAGIAAFASTVGSAQSNDTVAGGVRFKIDTWLVRAEHIRMTASLNTPNRLMNRKTEIETIADLFDCAV